MWFNKPFFASFRMPRLSAKIMFLAAFCSGFSFGQNQNERPTAHEASNAPRTPYIPTEEDKNPNVARRPGFVQALARQRIVGWGGFRFFGVEPPPGAMLERESIPEGAIAGVWKLCELVFVPSYLPAQREQVEWISTTLKSIDVRQKEVAGKWTIDGQAVVVSGMARGLLTATLRFSGEDCVPFRVQLPDDPFVPPDVASRTHDAVDKSRILEIFNTYYRFPFEQEEDFVIYATSRIVADVPIFYGRIEAKLERIETASKHWYDEATLFVTGTDPQYFCITVRFPDGA